MILALALACYVPDPKRPPEDTDTGETGDTAETGETGETAETGETGETGETAETDDCPTVYADADGDGYGDPTKPEDGCLDTGVTVSDNTDCDDADADVHPGAVERCNEEDDDCDGDAADGGVVTFTDEGGAWSDVSGAFAGVIELSAGTYDVCPGTYTAWLSTSADVRVQGHGGPIFDGASEGTVFTVTGGALDLEDVVVQDGLADFVSSVGKTGGGGVACSNGTLTLGGVTLASNSAHTGGAVLVDDCDAEIVDGYLSGNFASSGAAIAVTRGSLLLTRTEIAFNSAVDFGGGIDLEGLDGEATLAMVDSSVHTNSAMYGGGVAALYTSTVTCTGSSSVAAGIWSNAADLGGGVALFGAEAGAPSFEGVACDFLGDGANTPDDIYLLDEGVAYSGLGDDKDVSCSYVSCD